jgi:cell division protein ZapB
MSETSKKSNTRQELDKLEEQVKNLLQIIERLKQENLSLQEQQDSLVMERASLIKKTELARSRVEAIVTRLKSMEQGT